MISNNYNSHESRARAITSENTFAKGMKFSNNPLTEGYVKTLINFNLTDNGATIKPRLGYQQIEDALTQFAIDEATQDFCVYLTESLLIQTPSEEDAVMCRTVLSGPITPVSGVDTISGKDVYLFDITHANVTALYMGQYVSGMNECVEHLETLGTDDCYYLAMQKYCESIHDVPLEVGHSRNGISAVMDNNAYFPLVHTYKDADGNVQVDRHAALLKMRFTEDYQSIVWWVEYLQPKDVTAVQAVNYGYNMLKPDPYKFENLATANAVIQLEGLLPYDSTGKLLTSARTGAEIFFHLVYRYPNADVEGNKKYRVRWSVQDLDSDSDAVIVQDYLDGGEYAPGDDIYFRTTQTTYKRFTLIANVVYASEVTAGSEEPKPLATLTLAYYYLTNDNNTSTLNVEAVNYDLSTAQGMCIWQQRLVLWGVQNAKNTLWVSEINDPSWFPYPNNSEIFPDDIVACVRYKTSLLVFTRSALYQLDFQDDGLSYSTRCIQERLTMEEQDISSIIPVQNMVFFKNGNAYFMIVPVSASITGELQLAPITRPIEQVFTEFRRYAVDLLETVVLPNSSKYYLVNENGYRLLDDAYHQVFIKSIEDTDEDANVVSTLYDWWCALENKVVRVYFKYQVNAGTKTTFIDLIFNYDTYTRAWTMSIVNSTRYRMTHYISSVTAETIFVQPTLISENTIVLNLIQGTAEDIVDHFDIDYNQTAWGRTVQYLDTGFRDLNPDIKKRFRQVQFRVNNIQSETLNFYTSFAVDNELRKMYNKNTTEITDPEAEDYGTVYVDPELADPDVVPGTAERMEYCEEWELDQSRFPESNTAQVRLNVSGKGNLCRFELRSFNSNAYEISSMAWVYRPMYAR